MAVGIDCVGWLSFGVRWDGRRDIIFESALEFGTRCGMLLRINRIRKDLVDRVWRRVCLGIDCGELGYVAH